MGKLRPPQPVYLIMGLIYPPAAAPEEMEPLREIEPLLEESFGETELKSQAFSFGATGYYAAEMGPGLKRVFYGFKRLIDPGDIVDIKIAAIEIEERTGREGKRRFNLDPGYMDFNKLVLVSAKFMAQKVYLSKGVYADPAIYYDRGWKAYDWAFPDLRSRIYDGFFTEARNSYKAKMKVLSQEKGIG